MNLDALRARLAEIHDEMRAIHTEAGDNALSDEQSTRFDTLDTERQTVQAGISREERRAALVASIPTQPAPVDVPARTVRSESGQFGSNVQVRRDPFDVLEDRSLTGRARTRALTDALLRANEDKIEGGDSQAHFERLLKRHGNQVQWAENLLLRSKDDYADAFTKVMQGRAELLSNEERAAIAVGTTTQGGYLVPTHLDPTLLITNDGSSNIMRSYATVTTLVDGKTWNGVTSAGVTASWDAELAEVSDDSPTFGTAAISVYKPQAFVGASIEAFDDINGLATDVLMLFADARDRLEGAAHMTGTGSAPVPLGLFTAINASSTLQITSSTAATIDEALLDAVVEALPVRFRRNAKFVMHPKFGHAIKRLGTAVSSTFSGDLTAPVTDRILGYGAVYTDDAPSAVTTTALDQELVFADLSQYRIVDKPGGTSIEFVPVLFGSNGRPNGTRGWYMHWRTGAGMPVLQAGRIMLDKTSA